MQNPMTTASSTSHQLRPVVITVIAAKLAVLALLMTTVNAPAPFSAVLDPAVQVASLR